MNEADYMDILEDVLERRRRGEPFDLEAYRDQLGPELEAFRAVLALQETMEQVMDPRLGSEDLPRRFGEYTLLRELGHGAIGIVYEAYHDRLDRHVAIKTLRPEVEAEAKFRERYEREARSCARVRHPHLVEIYEAGEVEGRLFYAMPFLTGGSLQDAIDAGAVPEPVELCRRTADVADALGALHAANIVHRDIKPANIMVEQDGRFVLADFGLARRIDLPALTAQGHSVGTPAYMSPEQLLGDADKIDARTDVYALGATLYQALTNRLPFEATSVESLHHQVLTARPPSPDTVVAGLSPAVAGVVMRCLARHRADRYATARELAADLRAAAAGEATAPPPAAPAATATTATHRAPDRVHPLRPLHLLVGILGLAVLVLGVVLATRDEPAAPQPPLIALQLPEGGQLDLDTIRRYAEANGLPVIVVVAPDRKRAFEQEDVQLVFPRGRVRVEDLDRVRVDVSATFGGEGRLVFRRDDEELATVPFAPESFVSRLELPPAVLAEAKPGVRVTWVYEQDGRAAASASFEVVEADLGSVFERIDAIAALEGQPPELRALLRAQAFLERGLGLAAYRELEPLRAEALEDERPAVVRLQVEALRRALGEDEGARRASRLYHELGIRLEDLGVK